MAVLKGLPSVIIILQRKFRKYELIFLFECEYVFFFFDELDHDEWDIFSWTATELQIYNHYQNNPHENNSGMSHVTPTFAIAL